MIRVLDPQTVGQIAAGEVVERPLSVVKELVENAVDAAAGRITVAIEDGGSRSIEVSDDGLGIPAEDLPLAVRRHATSKLVQAVDLESVETLGFRGEGLASIASVARVSVVSRTPDREVGARIEAFAETSGPVSAHPAPFGTCVRAEDLFVNVPVRREYLRSASAEFNRISGWLSSFALAYPTVTFTLLHDGKEIWVMPASPDIRARLSMVFGKGAAETLLTLDAAAGRDLPGGVSGYISAPGNDRPDRRLQLLFVNGRLLRSTLLAGAWTAGYSTFAMIGRQPFGAIFLNLPPDQVDPNVHPTKSDVRLRYGRQVFEAVRRAIASTLRAHAGARFATSTGVSAGPPEWGGSSASLQSLFTSGPEADPSETGTAVPRVRVLGQLHRTYILASDGEALLLIDQHAAHERVAYEKIVHAARDHAPSEPLLVPHTFELSASESATLDRALDVLREGGLEVESFGQRSYRIVATPAGYGARNFDVAGFVDDLSDEPKERDVRERLWASLACHSVTRAGDRLELAEMSTLIERLQLCENPMHCPHGRPTIVRLEPDAIARLFKRM